ncbi:MAG: biotin--[acetyl-CoA-carboxylase] ligase [Verrucomicrobiales bacterium]|nr:biotin--[acetyl-CoA-carboxylase] ligase [Verrucomicrobiales bacterium]
MNASPSCLPISEGAVRRELEKLIGKTRADRFQFSISAETASTNGEAKLAGLNSESDSHVFLTEHQTAGRGRRENRWESPPGANLLFSILQRIPDDISIQNWTRVPHLAALSIGMGIESCIPDLQPIQLKWPNDLMIGGKKLAGILVESNQAAGSESSASFCVVGTGLNVNMADRDLPGSIRHLATSLAIESDQLHCRAKLLAHILAEWSAVFPGGLRDFESIRTAVDSRSYLRGHSIEILQGDRLRQGKARGIGEFGELILETSDGNEEQIYAADQVRRTVP